MPSIHKIYEYGNIATEELFDIDISEKVHNTEEMIKQNLHHSFLLLQDAMKVLPRMPDSPRIRCSIKSINIASDSISSIRTIYKYNESINQYCIETIHERQKRK